jgi:hypothetical protein
VLLLNWYMLLLMIGEYSNLKSQVLSWGSGFARPFFYL